MEIKDNKTGVPLEHYISEFSAQNPLEMSEKSGVPYENGAFQLTIMGRGVKITWPDMEAEYTDTGDKTKANVRILLARLIMKGRLSEPTGKMCSFTELPWGNVYEQQFKGRCIMRLAFGFGNDLNKFEAACKAIAGVPAKGGDKAFDIPFLPKLTVRLMVWEGDDEFPPSSQILFSDNFPNAYTAEDLAVTGDIILDAMKGRW